jgi:hypothetical protein
MGTPQPLSPEERARLGRASDVAPAHVNEWGGIDLTTECSCVRAPMIKGTCPCRCHEGRAARIARHRRLHISSAGWCPACRAIEAGGIPDPLA